jgi:hypothetical protein
LHYRCGSWRDCRKTSIQRLHLRGQQSATLTFANCRQAANRRIPQTLHQLLFFQLHRLQLLADNTILYL